MEDFEYQLRAEKEYVTSAAATAQTQSAATYIDPTDNTVYEWDALKKGWFPKIDDDFLAKYHASYGVHSTGVSDTDTFAIPSGPPPSRIMPHPSLNKNSSSHDAKMPEASGIATKRNDTELDKAGETKKPKINEKQVPTWFDMDKEKNHNVYVSGLPLDITLEEFIELMTKYGIIMENEDGKPKVKLYRNIDGELKGDGLCCYLKAESISLALNILDGSTLRGSTISVERARFVQKGEYNPALKKKKSKNKKKGNKQAKLLDWRERRSDGPARKKCERIIVFKNVFDPKEFDEDPTTILEIRNDLQEECAKFGTVKKILIFDRHPEGIASVAFAEFEAADMCVLKMNQRWYGGRQLEVAQWDGLINFQVEETDQEREQRIEKWEKFIKDEEPKEEDTKE